MISNKVSMSLRTLLFFALCTSVIKVYSQNTNAITPSVTNGDFEADNFNDWKVIAIDENGNTTNSGVYTFRTN